MKYDIYNSENVVGCASVTVDGLFLTVVCSASMENSQPLRFFVESNNKVQELGTCPPGGNIVRKFSSKRIGKDDLNFFAIKKEDCISETVCEDKPFSQIEKLPQARLRQFENQLCIEFTK